MKFPVKKRVNLKLRDAFRVEALEPRVLLSADPIIGMAAIMLPDDTGHDFLVLDAYQGAAAPAVDDAASHAQVDQVLAANTATDPVAPAAATPAVAPASATPAAAPPAAGATIASDDHTRTIFLGDDAAGGLGSNGALYVSNDALGNLTGGYSNILVGGADSNAHIVIGDTSGTKAIVLTDSLTLMNPQSGGEIFINQQLDLQGDSGLTIFGSGHTTIVSNQVSASFAYVADSVLINGANVTNHTISITATAGGIQIGNNSGHTLNGVGTAPDDHLVLSATGDIEIYGTVGNTDPLEGLTVTTAHDIHFRDTVTVNGDLFINATGTVTFDKPVHLTAGSLHVTGAGLVYFKAGVIIDGGGDVLLEGNEIDLLTGEGGFVGTGTLTLRPTTVGMNIDIAGPPLENSADLNLSSTELAAFSSTFSKIIIGRQDGLHADQNAGDVRIGAIQSAQQFTLRDRSEIYGKNITVEDFNTAGFNFLVNGSIMLDAYHDININNRLDAVGNSVTLYAQTGAITQADGVAADDVSSETVRGFDLRAHAGNGIYLPWLQVNSVTAVNTGDGALTIGNLARDSARGIGGALQVDEVSQSSLLGDAIAISTSAGSITLAQTGVGVHTVSGAAIGISAGGAASQIIVNQSIGGASGAITLAADGAINVALATISDSGAGAISLTSVSSDISVAQNISSAGGLVHLGAGRAVGMVSGTSISSIDALGDSGAVTINAVGAITVSVINADGVIGLASSANAIIDGLTGDGLNLDGDTATATLAAATGIGSSAPLYTRVAALSVNNATSGNVFVREATALRLLGASLAGSGASLGVLTLDGGIVVEGAVNSTGASGSGNILLQSRELGEATLAAIEVRANIGSNLGSISLLSADEVVDDDLGGGAPLIETRAAGKTIDIAASGAITMEAQARLQSNNGNIRVEATAGDITLGVASAGSAAISLRAASGSILDGQADDATTRVTNLSAGSVRLAASGTIGTSTNALETGPVLLALSGSGAYLLSTGALTIGSVTAVGVDRVAADASISSVADSAGLIGATASNGDMVLAGAAVIVNEALAITAGNLRLQSNVGAVTVNAGVTADLNITMLSSGRTNLNAGAILTALAGTMDLASTNGAIAMADGARAITNARNIRVASGTNTTISLLDARSNADRAAASLSGQASWGNVSVIAANGIYDTEEAAASTDLYAATVRLNGGAIGSSGDALDIEAAVLSAVSTSAVFLNEASALTMGPSAAISVARVLADGTVTPSVVTDAVQNNLQAAGALVLQAAGAITTVSGGAVSAGGNLLLASNGDITLGAAVATIGTTGNISVNSGNDILQNAAISAAGAGQSIDLVATRHITMADGTATASNGGNIGLRAGTNVIIETLNAGSADVSVNAGGSIVDQDASGDTEVDIVAINLQLNAGGAIGVAANALETTVATVSARAGSGGVYLAETDTLLVDTVSVQVNCVDTTATATVTAYAAQSNLVATGAGNVVATATTLTISDYVSAVSGNILLKATTGNLTINNSVTSTSGAISLAAGAALAQKALVSGSSIDALAATGISMANGVAAVATGNVRYQAGAVLAVGSISSGATVSLKADSIVDSGTTDIDVSALALLVQAVSNTGSGGAHLQTTVATLAGNGGSTGLFIDEADALQIGTIAGFDTARVATDGTLGAVHDNGATALAAGAIVITSGGAISVDVGIGATSGNIRLQSTGATADITVNDAITNFAGNTTLAAGRDLLVNGAVASTVALQSVDLQAVHDVILAQGSTVTATTGNIGLTAGRNAIIETISTAGSVSIVAQSGAITDGDSAGDTEVDVTAASLSLRAATGIGFGANHIETTIGTLSAQGGSGGVYLTETDSVTVDGVTVQVNRVDSLGVATATTNAVQHNLTATGSGNVVLRSSSGAMTISDTVSTATGKLLLQADGGGLMVNDAISAAGGAISLNSAGGLALRANITNSGSGTIELTAAGALSMIDGTSITGAANIRATAGTVMTVGAIATSANVDLIASAIVDSGTTDIDVSALRLRIVATDASINGSGIGSGAQHLQIAVGTLAGASAGTAVGNGVYFDAIGAVTIDSIPQIVVNHVALDGTAAVVSSAVTSDLTSTGNLVLTATGAITVNQGIANATGVSAAGNLLLQSSGVSADVSLNAEVLSSAGSVTINAGRDLVASSIIASAAGASIDLAAARNFVMLNASLVQTNAGNIAARAVGDATIELINAGAGSIAITAGGSIIDQDGSGDNDLDIIGNGVQLSAGNAIGSAASSLETTIATLSANAGAGGVYVSETDALLIDSVTVQVKRVDATGAATLTTNALQANLSATGAGNIAISASDLIISDDVNTATGAILLNARTGALTQNNAVASTSGATSMLSATALTQKALIATGGTVDVASSGASLTMDDGVVTTAGGNVRYAAANAIAVGAIVTGANVSLKAASILDAGGLEVDVSASQLRLETSSASAVHLQTAIATVAARVSDGLSLIDTDGLSVGSVAAIGVNRLAQDGSVSLVTDAALASLANGGNLLLQTGGLGDLVLDRSVYSAGNISLNSAGDIIQNAVVAASGAGHSADLLAARDLTMGDAGILITDAGAISLRAVAGSVTVGRIDARSAVDSAAEQLNGQTGWGAVSISAAGGIADNVEATTTVDIFASAFSANGSTLGSAANYLETEVASLAGAIGVGGVFVQDASAVTIGANAAVNVNRVAYDGSTGVVASAAQSGLSSTAAVVVSSAGALNVASAVNATGNLLLRSADDILVNASVASSAGSISLNAGRDIVQSAAITTAANGKTIDLLAGRDIAMAAGSVGATTNGDLLLAAGRDITIATLNAGSGSVGINAGAIILDVDGAGDSLLNISAAGLQIKAGNAIGAGSSHLEVAVSTLSAAAGAGGMYISEADGVSVTTLAVQAQRIDGNAIATSTVNAAQTDLRTADNGNIVLASAGGPLLLNGAAVVADGSGNILISGGDIAVNGNVASTSGNVTVLAAGAIAMMGSTSVSGAQVRLAAAGNVALGNITASSASVNAGGAISAASGSALNGSVNVNASTLRLQAGGAIGSGGGKLSTAVDVLSASAAGMYITERDGININAAAPVQQVNLDGSSSAASESLLAGLVSSADGSIILTAGGGVTVLENELVAASGSGNVLLQAQGGALSLGMNADVVSGSGHVSLIASGAVALAAGADLRTAGSGDIDVETGSTFTQLDGSVIVNADGSIRVQAAGDVLLASIASVGNVAITSLTGSILEDGDAATDIAAEGLRLFAAGSIGKLGAGADALDISVGTVSARAGNGGINLLEASDIVVGDVSVAVNVVNADGTTSIASVARQADLRTLDNGSIVLNAANSFIILNEGSGAVDGAVAADGSGNVLLNAGVSIIANADVISGSGHVTLLGATLIEFKANADIRTSGAGSIDVEASNGAILQNTSSLFNTGSGSVRLLAQTSITIGDIVTGGDASVTAVTSFIRDADALANGANDSDNDITARALRLSAGGAIGVVDLTGSTSNAIETAVGTVSVRAGGAIGIANRGAVSLGSVAASVCRVGLDGVAVLIADAAQAGVIGSGATALNIDGDLNIDADVSATSLNLASNRAVNISAGVTVAATGGAATIDAKGGALSMAGSASVNASGNLRLHAASDVVVGNLAATNVSLVADSGAIVNAAGSTKNVSATTLRLQADDAIGSAARHLTTAVGTVSAASRGTDSSGIYLTEDDALVIGSTGFGVDAAQNDLRAANGSINLDTGGAVSMAGTVNLVAAGALAIHAATGAITAGNFTAATVSLTADSGAIVNAAGSARNISADSALLRASGAIGTSTRALSTGVASLDAAASALYVAEDNAIRLTALSASTGNLVVTTIDGAIAVDGAVSAARNVLLAAGGAGADLALGNSVTSATGSISLRGGRDVLVNGLVQTRAVAQTIDLVATRNLAMGEGSSVTTLDSAILLMAGGDVTVETLNAGSGNVRVNAGGSVIDQDGAGDADIDISAAGLRISAGGAIGSAANRLETNVASIAAAAGASLFIDERDGVTIGSVDVVVSRIDASGVKTTVGAGALTGLAAGIDVDLVAAGAISQLANISAAGNAQLRAGGAIAMADGSVTSATAVSYTAAGDIIAGLLDAGSGSVALNAGGSIADAQAANAVQTVNVRAGSASLSVASGIGAAANALETAVATLSANTAAGDLVIRELDSLNIGAAGLSAAAGNVVLTLDSGTLDLSHSFNSAAGKDLTLAADHIVFDQAVRGNGGKLTISAADPLADVRAGSGGVIDQASLAKAGGYAQVVLGAGVAGSGQDVRVDGTVTPVGVNDALLLNVTGSGSVITVAGQVAAQSIDARGALAVDGNVKISAGNGAAATGGDMLFEQSIDGAAPGAVLALAAGGDNVIIQGVIGAVQALAGFSIDNAANVSFAQNVTVAGPVVINATGTVRFDGVLTLNGGSLTIRGASEVIIGDVVFHGLAGVVVMEANTLTLNGDVQGAGTVTLHPTDIGRDIVVGGVGGNGSYNVTSAQLAHLATATQVIIGTQGVDGHAAVGAGAVTVNPIDFAALTGAPIQVYGSVVTLAAGSGTLNAAHGVVLDGRDGVVLHDSVGSTLGDILVYSALGGVSMDADALIAGSAGVTIQGAGNLSIGLVQGKDVVLKSGGVILDAAADDKVNVTATSVSIIGYGPKLGSGNAVEVQAPAIYVSAPTGMVLQDTGSDGLTHFYVLDGATMYEQAIAIGTVTRSTAAPAAATSSALAALSAPSALPATAPASFADHASSASTYLASLGGAGMIDGAQPSLLTASANGLQTSALASTATEFDYWLEDLML